MTDIQLVEFTKGEVRNLSGHERGLAARMAFKLEDLDALPEPIEVVVPEDLDAISTSFFQGMFAQSIQRLGSRDRFLEHYRFHARPHLMLQVQRGIDAVQTRRKAALA